MTKGNNWKDIKTKMTPEQRQRSKARAKKALVQIMALDELRKSRNITQEQLAEAMDSHQARISQMAGQTDMLVSTLQEYIAAMGGRLKIVAEFKDGDVELGQFEN